MDLKTESQLRQELVELWALLRAEREGHAALRKDAERYRWLRDEGSASWMPFTRQWDMNAEHCDAAIDNEMATHRLFCAA